MFHSSGYFSVYEKLRDAVLKNIKYTVIAAVVAVVYITVEVSSGKGSLSNVVGFMMAAGNTYGLLLIILLMGSGLVNLPRRLWQMSDYSAEQTKYYLLAPSVESAYNEARYELEDCEAEIRNIFEAVTGKKKTSCTKECFDYITIIRDKAVNFEFVARSTTIKHGTSDSENDIVSQLTKPNLVRLHATLLTAQIRLRAAERHWKSLVSKSKLVDDLLLGNPVHSEEDTWCQMRVSSTTPDNPSFYTRCKFKMIDLYISAKQFWSKHCFRYAFRFFSICCTGASFMILWSELVMASSLQSPLGSIINAYSGKDDEAIVIQSVSFVALFYMSVCTYWSLFQINLGWQYKLSGPQLSNHSSLVFNAQYVSRLQFSLGFNFLMILHLSRSEMTAFNNLMKNITIIPLFGTSFNVYSPVIMILVALTTCLNLYSRILRVLGFDDEDALSYTSPWCFCGRAELSEEDKETFAAGKKLIEGELRRTSMLLKTPAQRDVRSSRGRGSYVRTKACHEQDEDSDSSSVHSSSIQMIPKQSLHESSQSPPRGRGSICNSTGNILHQHDTNKPSSAPKFNVKEVDIDTALDSDLDFNFDTDFSEHGSSIAHSGELTARNLEKIYNVHERSGETFGGRYADV